MRVSDKIHANGGARFRQYSTGEFGGSIERVLELRLDGRFDYVETQQYEGGFSRHPQAGRWKAEGDLPAGRLILNFDDGATLSLRLEYDGGDTCRIDGVPTYVS